MSSENSKAKKSKTVIVKGKKPRAKKQAPTKEEAMAALNAQLVQYNSELVDYENCRKSAGEYSQGVLDGAIEQVKQDIEKAQQMLNDFANAPQVLDAVAE